MEPIVENTQEYVAPKSLNQLVRMVDEYLSSNLENDENAKRDRDYFDGKQLSDQVLETLKARGQPTIHTNVIKQAISGMLGVLDSTQTAIEAYPRTYKDTDSADTATKILRYLADRGQLQKVKRDGSSNFFIEGTAAAIIEYDGNEITTSSIRWSEFVFDPYSREHNFSDATYLGVGKLMDRSDVSALYTNFESKGSDSEDLFGIKDSGHKAKYWSSKDRDMVRVLDLYYRVGGLWHRAVFTQSELLYAGPSEYEDDYGFSICPVRATSYEVSREGERYGHVRNMVPLQDEVNARRSRFLHLVNHRQVQQTDLRSRGSEATAKREAAKADGAIPFGWATSNVQDMAQGQMLIYEQSRADLERMSPSPALLGRSGGANESGRARMISQQAGLSEHARTFGRLEEWELEIYRTIWAAARQYMTETFVVRITDDPRSPQFLTINEEVKEPMPKPVIGEDDLPVIDPMTGQPAIQIVETTVAKNNELAKLDMDIILATVPDPISLQHEVFQTLLEYAASTRLSPFSPEFAAVIEMSPMPNKRETLERLQAAMEKMSSGGPNPVEEKLSQLAVSKQEAEIQSELADAAKDNAKAKQTQMEVMRAMFGVRD